MLVSPDEKVPLARRYRSRGIRRFLQSQARQEAMQALVFQGAIA